MKFESTEKFHALQIRTNDLVREGLRLELSEIERIFEEFGKLGAKFSEKSVVVMYKKLICVTGNNKALRCINLFLRDKEISAKVKNEWLSGL